VFICLRSIFAHHSFLACYEIPVAIHALYINHTLQIS